MWSKLVVVPTPCLAFSHGVVEAHDPARVQALRLELSVARFDGRVVGRPARPTEVERDVARVCRNRRNLARHLYGAMAQSGPVAACPVSDDHTRIAAVGKGRSVMAASDPTNVVQRPAWQWPIAWCANGWRPGQSHPVAQSNTRLPVA